MRILYDQGNTISITPEIESIIPGMTSKESAFIEVSFTNGICQDIEISNKCDVFNETPERMAIEYIVQEHESGKDIIRISKGCVFKYENKKTQMYDTLDF